MARIKRDPEYVVPRAVVDGIVAFLRGRDFRTLHYLGYADDELIKALIREERYTISLMDYWDRHHRETIDFLSEEGIDHSHLVVPDWLNGIPTYIEGAPRHEVLLQDIPWLDGQLDRLESYSGRENPRRMSMSVALGGRRGAALETDRGDRNAPPCIVLFGDAQSDASHPRYDWRTLDSLRVGLRRDRPRRRASAQRSLF